MLTLGGYYAFIAVVGVIAGFAAGRWLERRRARQANEDPPAPVRVPSSYSEDLVTVAAFDQPYQAHLARFKLQQHHIPAVVTDEHIVGVDWYYATAVGGVKVLVQRAALERAELVLSQTVTVPEDQWRQVPSPRSAPTTETEDDVRCPQCGSTEVYRVPAWRRSIFAGIIVLGFPLPIWGRRYECDTCSHQWRGEKD